MMWHGFIDRPERAVGRVPMPLPPPVDPWAPHPLFPPRPTAVTRSTTRRVRPLAGAMIER